MPIVQQAHRLASISRFVVSTYGKVHQLQRRTIGPEEAGRWIAAESARMGPLFVKLAQLVSARGDALDPSLVAALSVVQDKVQCDGITCPNLDGYQVDCAGGPLKAGSVASVWLATRLADNVQVVIKKLHNGVRESFQTDLPAISGVLQVASIINLPGAKNFHEIIQEAQPMLLLETDMHREGVAMQQFREAAPGGVVVPQVYECGPDYIVQEYVPARKISQVQPPCEPLARRLMEVFVRSILEPGIVHADPHPGNIGVLTDGTLVLYDWGACVDVTRVRSSLVRLVGSLATGDLEGFVGAMQDVGVLRAQGSDSYRVVKILEKLADTPPEDFHVSLSQQPEFADSAGNRLVRFSSDTVYLLRALSLVEGVCRRLDPQFSYQAYWEKDLRALVEAALEEQSGDDIEIGTLGSLGGWLRSAASMPRLQRRTLDTTLQMNLELRDEILQTRRALSQMAVGAMLYLALQITLALRI